MTAGGEIATAGILYYLLAYTLMNMGAFGIVVLFGRKGEKNVFIEDYRGAGARYPAMAAAMALFMFSMAGIPPDSGIFRQVLRLFRRCFRRLHLVGSSSR